MPPNFQRRLAGEVTDEGGKVWIRSGDEGLLANDNEIARTAAKEYQHNHGYERPSHSMPATAEVVIIGAMLVGTSI